ncbi:MAG: acyltransferase 3, partial [Enterovirga sp.]|nr:acyltransferase 3 [Enterovirga sp.]
DEPLARLTGFTLGEHAVNGFFAISGFLVTMSFCRRGWRDYVLARALRIAPGLIAATAVVALGFGLLLTRLPAGDYLRDPGLWRFVGSTLGTFKSNTVLPGVFADNPFRMPMGTVWTLKYEVLCYGGVLLAGIAGALRGRWPALLVAGGLLVALIALDAAVGSPPKGVETALRLPFLFAAGAALYLWRDRVPASPALALGLIATAGLASASPLYRGLLFAAEAYGVIWLALWPALVRPTFDLRQDLSYGVYLYGWPIQQGLRQVWPGGEAWTLLAPSLGLALAAGWLSWNLVERPALALKARALGRRIKTIEPAAP